MNDYSKTYYHLEKSESFMNKKRLNAENKSEIKFEKFKRITKTKDSLSIKHRLLKKMNQQNAQKNQHAKKLANSYYINEKYKSETKKLTHNKSFNYGRKKPNDINIKINNTGVSKDKSLKKINFNNNETFFDNYDKNKLNRRSNLNYNEKSTNTYTNINNTSQIEGKKFSSSYFNTLYKKEKNDDIFSRSQNLGNKKNVLRRINTNFSVNKDKYQKSFFNLENEFNKSQTNFHDKIKKNSTDFFRPNIIINNNHLVTEANANNEEANISVNYNSISKYDNNTPINIHRPIKLYKDKDNNNNNKNNTNINLPGSFNFHQYFNTYINKVNNNNQRNSINNRNYNKSLASIESNNKLYNNSQYCQTQICNTNESENKLNTLSINDSKLIEDINEIKNDLENSLKQNPTNSKSKKYNTLKRFFEKFLMTLKDYFLNNEINPIYIFLQKIIMGYHDVVLAFSGENRKLKILNYQYVEEYQKIDKNFIQCNNLLKEKQNELDNLGKKISILIDSLTEYKKMNVILKNKLDEINFNNIKNNLEKNIIKESKEQKAIEKKEKNEQYNKIKNINANNLDDLDALYFWDKVEMKPQRSYSSGKVIPYLPIISINK